MPATTFALQLRETIQRRLSKGAGKKFSLLFQFCFISSALNSRMTGKGLAPSYVN